MESQATAQPALLIGDADTRRDVMDDAIMRWVAQDSDACRACLAAAKGIPADWVERG